jgi:hypothetical protein
MNKTAGFEWLEKGWHHLSTAKLLDQCNHYTYIIGVELHYSIEICLKAILKFANQLLNRVCTLLKIPTNEIKSEPN